jgi:hypothetical protein
MFSGLTSEDGPFRLISRVVALRLRRLFSISPLGACLLRAKSVYWDNPPPPFPVFPILSALAVRIDRGWIVERNGIEKGDDWGID